MNNESFDINGLIKQIEKDIRAKQEKLIANDIIDIYEHVYLSYEDYVHCKLVIKEFIEEKKKECLKHPVINYLEIFLNPYLITKELFEYIFNLKKERNTDE